MIGHHREDDAEAFVDALRGRRPARGEVAQLVRVAERVSASAAVEPSSAFRTSLRESLMAQAATDLVPRTPPRRGVVYPELPARRPVRRRLAGLAAAAVASVGVVGMVSSSASAVPGEMLYPVKRGVENVQLTLQDGPEQEGRFQLERASTRLGELNALIERDGTGDPERVSAALDDFTEQARDGSATLFDSFGASGSETDIDAVNTFAAAAAGDLGALSALVPEDSSTSFDDAAVTVTSLAVEAARLCGACAEADVSDLARAVSSATTGRSAPSAAPGAEAPSRSAEQQDEPVLAAPQPTGDAPAPAPAAAAPVAPQPSASPTRRPDLVTGVTEPVVGALLGDEDQEGLVPGLLGGLLGGNR